MKKVFLIIVISLISLCGYSQMGQWTWMNGDSALNSAGHFGTQGVFTPLNSPPAFYEACEWTDKHGDFWLFGGFGDYGDLWEFKPAINQWAWIKGTGTLNQIGTYGTKMVPSLSNLPGARSYGVATWVDTAGYLWLFGGEGFDATGGYGELNDLWRYSIATNEWTWMSGTNMVNDVGHYGTKTVADTANRPSGRYETNASWTDNNNNLWLFGGRFAGAEYSDLWMYDMSLQEWVWMTGPNIPNQPAIRGTLGVPNSANTPNARSSYAKWKKTNGDFLLFAGTNFINEIYNDVWRFNPNTHEWTWLKGPSAANDTGLAGTKCIPAVELEPRALMENRACWTRACDNFVCFGGGNTSVYNDLWNYNAMTNSWSVINGSLLPNQPSNYGTKLVSSPSNMPSSRAGSLGWTDSLGNFWMFGGGLPSGQMLNDLWKYVPDSTCPNLGSIIIVSNFTAQPLSGCNPMIVSFTNSSINGTSYYWSFGDNTYSTISNPVHNYSSPGTYIVKLLANTSCSLHPDSSTLSITVYPDPIPVISGGILCDSMPTILDAGSYMSYLWNTGETNETITVTVPNLYSLTVTDINGCTGTTSITVTVNVFHPVAAFTSDYTLPIYSGDIVHFKDDKIGRAHV